MPQTPTRGQALSLFADISDAVSAIGPDLMVDTMDFLISRFQGDGSPTQKAHLYVPALTAFRSFVTEMEESKRKMAPLGVTAEGVEG